MIPSSVHSRQPLRQPWTHECLFQEWAIALGQAIDNSTWKNYGSALNSYLNFVKMHNFPLEPTSETLSLFTIYMSHHIKPNSVTTYLSGICQQLKPYFPNIRSACNSTLVHCTLQGCRCCHAVPTSRKCALTLGDLETVINALGNSMDYDDCLFIAQLLTGFFALFHLGEMTYPDNPELCDPRKVTKCNSVWLSDTSFQFFLPGHKANRFFEGNRIIVWKNHRIFDPHKFFTAYLCIWDDKFPLSSPLWLKSEGVVPTHSFFIKRLHRFFNSDTARQSLQAGGTTSLAENGVPPSIIQAIGRWASNAFKIYIWKNPVLIQVLLFGQTTCAQSSFIHALESWLVFYRLFPIYFILFLQTFSELFTPPHLLTDMDLSHQYRLFLNPFPTHLPMDMDLSHQYGLAFFFLLVLFPSLLTSPTMWPHHTPNPFLFYLLFLNNLYIGI